MKLTEPAKKFLLGEPGEGMDNSDNPFINERGVVYMRFDGISIEPATDSFGGSNVCYKWNGRTVYSQRVEGADLKDGTSVHLNGFEGRVRVNMEGLLRNEPI